MFSGTKDNGIREYEVRHAAISRRAAADGIVLLKNEGGLLPLKKGSRVALFGAGASHTIKGGTGSGDVNERHSVSILEGLENAGFEITTHDWIAAYDKIYDDARLAWRQEIWDKAENDQDKKMGLFFAYSSTPFSPPAGPDAAAGDTDTAIYVLSRIAGEGADRRLAEGDYYISSEEKAIIEGICSLYRHVILVINAGGPVDLAFTDTLDGVEAILYISQLGQEGGHAFADVLTGDVTPSARLTDTWAYNYSDIPFADTYSYLNGDLDKEYYKDGIYVGYRYFDTFDVPVRYRFGYGLSYTEFEHKVIRFDCSGGKAEIDVTVKNTGDTFAGREVVQIYASCPSGELKKEYRRLTAFAKTGLLAPGEEETVSIVFPVKALTSYSEKVPGWVLEAGIYGIFEGDTLIGSLKADRTYITMKTERICPLTETIDELTDNDGSAEAKRRAWTPQLSELPQFIIEDIPEHEADYSLADGDISPEAKALADTLTTEQLISLVTGDINNNQNAGNNNIGSSGKSVPGSAAQTSACAEERGVGVIVLADGPAGLRLTNKYYVKDGQIVAQGFASALEGGFLEKDKQEPDGEAWYQYCTAFPVGTALAQTWDKELVSEIGAAVAEEMKEFGVALWLAPGMNIHRNPLCGRNFEYYSEDPMLSGEIAAAMTRGVQSLPGCGTTIKHFACNSQEDNRTGVDCVLSERALREIYLKGFELAIKHSHPLAIMTSYNLVNGIHAANNYDLCTKAVRCEWGYDGLIMTDWLTTIQSEDCSASGCMRAGNDIVMPGTDADHTNMKEELAAGTLSAIDLKRSAARVIRTVKKCK